MILELELQKQTQILRIFHGRKAQLLGPMPSWESAPVLDLPVPLAGLSQIHRARSPRERAKSARLRQAHTSERTGRGTFIVH